MICWRLMGCTAVVSGGFFLRTPERIAFALREYVFVAALGARPTILSRQRQVARAPWPAHKSCVTEQQVCCPALWGCA